MNKKQMVISGINLFQGGGLSIYKDFLNTLIELKVPQKYNISAFVHKCRLLQEFSSEIQLIELPDSRSHYYKRLYYEYIFFEKYSKKNNVDIWISLHDITPNVHSDFLYTYCHNSSPFLKCNLHDIKYNPSNFWFSLFYRYLYRINIKKNTAIIVQQNWIRQEFLKMYPIKNVIVAKPVKILKESIQQKYQNHKHKQFTFIFASLPRFFKNFQVICEASKIIDKDSPYEILLTLDGTENSYSREIYNKYSKDPHIKWIGIQSRERLERLYWYSDCLIFPSKLESWGLPISEYKKTGKPMLLARLPYSKEAVGTYDKVKFFEPTNAIQLSEYMCQLISNSCIFDNCLEVKPNPPYAQNWSELVDYILNKM